MRKWRWLRIGFALAFGVAAGILVWMLPPTPRSTLRIEPLAHENFQLERITSDGRFLLVQHTDKETKVSLEVWDTHGDLTKPWICPEAGQLSPDETAVVAAVWDGAAIALHLFELRTGAVKGQYQVQRHDWHFFGPEGTLYDYSGDSLVDLRTGNIVGPSHVAADALSVQQAGIDGEGVRFEQYSGPIVVDHEGRRRRSRSCLTGETLAEISVPAADWSSAPVSDDGTVWICCSAAIAGPGWPAECLLIDARTGMQRLDDRLRYLANGGVSPDGRVVCVNAGGKLPEWLAFLLKRDDPLTVIRRADNEELAQFNRVRNVCFSPEGNLLAVLHHDASIEVYEFPFARPRAMADGVGLTVALCVWGAAWLWTRRAERNRIIPAPGAVE